MRLRDQRGQITTENTVVAGMMVAAIIAVLTMATPWMRAKLVLVVSCVVSDVCLELNASPPGF
jgi:hypothetical protein